MAKKKTWWERDGKDILKRAYKTVYQVVIATVIAVLPHTVEIIRDSHYGAVLEVSPVAIPILTYFVSLVDNSIRSKFPKFNL
jgi:hypothetical protein